MDELYDFIWDVTLIEYIVSMHAKRGEVSRKRRCPFYEFPFRPKFLFRSPSYDF
jgi:hypothetical protein